MNFTAWFIILTLIFCYFKGFIQIDFDKISTFVSSPISELKPGFNQPTIYS